MNIHDLIDDLLIELSYQTKSGIPDLKNRETIGLIYEYFDTMGMPEIGQEIVQNLLSEAPEEKAFKNPKLNQVVKYKDKEGNDKEGVLGNLLRLKTDEPGREAAERALGNISDEERQVLNKELGGEGGGGEQPDQQSGGGQGQPQVQQGTALNPNTKSGKSFTDQLSPTDSEYTGPDKELTPEEKAEKTRELYAENRQKRERYLQNTQRVVTSQSINGIDGSSKENVLNGEEKVPGSPSSAVAEISVGYGMSCLSENNFDIKKADECLRNKLNETKLGKQYNNKEIRKGALQGAKRELIKIGKLIEDEGLNPETTTVSHVGGSKQSLSNTVQTLRDKGVTEVNGVPIDEYERIILEGGGGDNPTDTMVVVIDESTGRAFINHTSNKMTSADQISNGSPSKEIDEIGNLVSGDYDENQKVELEKAQQETKDNIEKHRNDQKEYIRQQQSKMAEDAKDPEIARKAVSRLKGGEGEENPISDSPTNPGKYWEAILGHKSVKSFAKEKGYDLKNLTPEQEIEIYQHYAEYMQSVDLELDRKEGGIGAADIQIITRLYGIFGNPKKNQEPLITGKDPKEPVFDEDELNSFYDKQTEEMNKLRERMNELKSGSGDDAFSKRMKKRLHLDVAEGANPGGIPNNKFETVMGEYARKDLKIDSDGNLYQQDKKTKKYYLVNSDGNISETPFDGELKDLDVSVVADSDTIKKCLGLEQGENIEDGIKITVDKYDDRKVIIYDRNGKKIGYQTARSKSGPGGAMQDTIAYDPEFQQCLAKQTVLMGK
jgi:hypothetical protein